MCGIVDAELRDSLLIAKFLIENSQPRTLCPWSDYADCNLIFADGAADDLQPSSIVCSNPSSDGFDFPVTQNVTVGGIIFSPRLKKPQFFGLTVTSEIVKLWQSTGSRQVIAQGELLPVLLAKRCWKGVLSHARNLFFIDNGGAREGLISGFSSSWSARQLLLLCKMEDARARSVDWYARVPTKANWGDGPSRLQFDEVNSIGAERIEVSCVSVSQLDRVDVLSLLRSL